MDTTETTTHTVSRMLGYIVSGVHVREEFVFTTYTPRSTSWNFLHINLWSGNTRIGRFESARANYRAYRKPDADEESLEKVSSWWRPPPPNLVEWLYHRALDNVLETLPARAPGVAWLIYTQDGRLVCELRSYVDEDGQPIPHAGKLNIPGGSPEASDAHVVKTLYREFEEEHYRKLLDVTEYHLVKRVYCADAGHMVFVYNINPTYETLLLRKKSSRLNLLKNLFETEGLGHPKLWKTDLEYAIRHGNVVPHIADFFSDRPAYLPAERPKS